MSDGVKIRSTFTSTSPSATISACINATASRDCWTACSCFLFLLQGTNAQSPQCLNLPILHSKDRGENKSNPCRSVLVHTDIVVSLLKLFPVRRALHPTDLCLPQSPAPSGSSLRYRRALVKASAVFPTTPSSPREVAAEAEVGSVSRLWVHDSSTTTSRSRSTKCATEASVNPFHNSDI